MNGEDAEGDVYLPNPLGPAMKADLPDVVDYVRLQDGWRESFVKIDDKVLSATLSYTDPSFFKIFSFEFVYGNPAQALRNLNDIVITRSKAKALFGSENILGRNIDIKVGDKFESFTITGVTEDVPANSSIRYEMLGHWQYMESTPGGKRSINNWNRSAFLTYIQLRSGSVVGHRDTGVSMKSRGKAALIVLTCPRPAAPKRCSRAETTPAPSTS
jgi:putative ABC transport system permease protein